MSGDWSSDVCSSDLVGSVGVTAVLLGGNAKEIAGLGLVSVHRQRTLELGLGLAGNDAAGGRDQRLAEIGAALGTVAGIGNGIAPGAHGIVIATEPRQHRRQHGPATAIDQKSVV